MASSRPTARCCLEGNLVRPRAFRSDVSALCCRRHHACLPSLEPRTLLTPPRRCRLSKLRSPQDPGPRCWLRSRRSRCQPPRRGLPGLQRGSRRHGEADRAGRRATGKRASVLTRRSRSALSVCCSSRSASADAPTTYPRLPFNYRSGYRPVRPRSPPSESPGGPRTGASSSS